MDGRVDPITLEIVQNALSAIADELALVIMRSAYSNIVRDSMDYSSAVCDHEGRTIAQGLTNPVHLGSFPDAMRNLVEVFDGDMAPGDVFLFNDPYGSGGMHLPDFYVIQPVFVAGRVEGYAATLAHQSDVGGIAPGGMAVFATEIFQEGLRIPALKLYEAGRPNKSVFRLIESNTRIPRNVMGDIRAQLAACATGSRALELLVARHGAEAFREYTAALHDYAERLMRAEIQALSDGVYEFEDFLDGLGSEPEPIRFKARVEISGDHVHIDWTGTSGQVRAAINGPFPTTKAMSYLGVRCAIGGRMPDCEGYTRAITVYAPEGTIVNPHPPAACGARGIICFRMFDTLLGAFSKVVPDRIPAANEGGSSAPHIAGRDAENRPFMASGGLMGCWGGRSGHDGQEGISNPAANLGNTPIELLESNQPVEITRYGFVRNSGGPGRWRGGVALMRGYRLLADEGVLIMRSDRRAVPPYGLSGGFSGTPSWNVINPGPDQRLLPVCPMESIRLERDDEFLHIQAGAGGFGDPLERDPERVRVDVHNELMTSDYARDVYGVVLTPEHHVDEAATASARDRLRQDGLHRRAYLEHFHSEVGIESPEKS